MNTRPPLRGTISGDDWKHSLAAARRRRLERRVLLARTIASLLGRRGATTGHVSGRKERA